MLGPPSKAPSLNEMWHAASFAPSLDVDIAQGSHNNIMRSGIGVGGYCLTKDPIIYSNPSKKLSSKPKSGCFSRKINEHAARSPYRSLIKFSKRNNLKLSDLRKLKTVFKNKVR